jgi:hypothetical protein
MAQTPRRLAQALDSLCTHALSTHPEAPATRRGAPLRPLARNSARRSRRGALAPARSRKGAAQPPPTPGRLEPEAPAVVDARPSPHCMPHPCTLSPPTHVNFALLVSGQPGSGRWADGRARGARFGGGGCGGSGASDGRGPFLRRAAGPQHFLRAPPRPPASTAPSGLHPARQGCPPRARHGAHSPRRRSSKGPRHAAGQHRAGRAPGQAAGREVGSALARGGRRPGAAAAARRRATSAQRRAPPPLARRPRENPPLAPRRRALRGSGVRPLRVAAPRISPR